MNNTENSYEGAVRRLQALGHGPPQPAFDLARPRVRAARGLLAPASPTAQHAQAQRIKDLEELAQLACDENDGLKKELDALRSENEELQRRIHMLEQTLENPRALLGLPPDSHSAIAGTMFAEAAASNTTEDAPFAQLAGRTSVPRQKAPSEAGGLVATLLIVAAIGALFIAGFSMAPSRGDSFTSVARLEAQLGGMLSTSLARAFPFHPRYGRDLLPANPAFLVTEAPHVAVVVAPIVRPVVAVPRAPVVAVPKTVAPAPKKLFSKVIRKAPAKSASKMPKHAIIKKGADSDPLGGLSL